MLGPVVFLPSLVNPLAECAIFAESRRDQIFANSANTANTFSKPKSTGERALTAGSPPDQAGWKAPSLVVERDSNVPPDPAIDPLLDQRTRRGGFIDPGRAD
jgi:hypothetical protein